VHVIADDRELADFLADDIGELTRTSFSPGVVLYQTTTAEFLDAASPDFSRTIETWLDLPHIAAHVEKTRLADGVTERHLFIVPVSEALPVSFFTDDFDTPVRVPDGFEGLDGLWIWSDYWHRYLVLRDSKWSWLAFPPSGIKRPTDATR